MKNWFVRTLVRGCIFVATLTLFVVIFLAIYTRHNLEIAVPDMTDLTVSEAQAIASKAGLRTEVGDSIFVRQFRKGAVFMQNPKPGAMVKKNRKIMLTINANNAKTVSMPSLVGFSMRQAKAELLSRDLQLGRLIYVNDMATNNVLKQQYKGHDIAPGTKIEAGSYINLVVGYNYQDGQTFIPDVRRMKYKRASDAVLDNSLNVGKLHFDSTVCTYADSLAAIVYSQSPMPSETSVTMGSQVSLYLTLDESKLPQLQ